ncbi:hypothetical protein BDZ97DRAFT_1653538 [Flammula alnicola]|nr:hypothetical protein BDZ97DRAFT_1653538 [Flammula alnicola]
MAQPVSLLSYNISLNLSSIFARLPTSRFFARLRKGAYETPLDANNLPASSVVDEWNKGTPSPVLLPWADSTPGPSAGMDRLGSFPTPWGFFTSWYMMGLFLMAVLLHRMQNVIIPSRIPHRRQRHAYRFAPNFAPRFQHTSVLRRLYGSILPLDFSRTTTRLILHLPSAYFLSRMLVIWFLLILQTSEVFPPKTAIERAAWWGSLGWLESLVQWSGQKEMSEICWETFCAVCAAFLVEGFVKALDGMGSGFPIGSANPNTSPFNLVGYAFLLHVYSSPTTHLHKSVDNFPSRPDKHVIITITIPLLQLTMFHILSISKRLSTHRLLPTALTSMLSLAHFHGTLFSHFRKSRLALLLPPTTTSSGANPHRSSHHVTYPLLNYIPNMFETLLICTILLTVFLNALAQLLVRGRVDRVFSGLGIGQGSILHDDDETNSPGFFQSLPFEEDFGVLLLRVGIASLEATGLRGWGNEVAPIQLPAKAQKRVRPGRRGVLAAETATQAVGQTTYGIVRMGRLGVGEVHCGSSSRRRRRVAAGNQRQQQKHRRGFQNEVRTVDLGNADGSGRRNGAHWSRWLKELGAYLAAVWGVLKGVVMFLLERARGRLRMRENTIKGGSARNSQDLHEEDKEKVTEDDVSEGEKKKRREKVLYQRFLRGEDISDDEDEDAEESLTSSEDIDESDDGHEDEEEREAEEEGEAEAVQLFTDLLRSGGHESSTSSTNRGNGIGSGSGEMALAHLMHGSIGISRGPLTRRRWNALVRQEGDVGRRQFQNELSYDDDDDDDGWDVPSATRTNFDPYGTERRDTETDGQERFRPACVICTSEARDIICWPCRCLAMCDNCREALASKSAPTKHRCPCCRQPVEGYSRIYIP